MSEREIAFAAADSAALDRSVEALSERFDVTIERALRHRLYYDTFDWRLWRAKGRLWATPTAKGVELRWHTEGRSRPRRLLLEGDLESTKIELARDLPSGAFRDALAEVIWIRRLLPVVDVRAEGRSIRVLDGRRKTVVRLFAEVPIARPPAASGPATTLAPILIVRPVRGYAKPFRRVAAFLSNELALEEWAADELEAGSELGGFGPAGAYSSKTRISLDRSSEAQHAVREVLASLLATLESNVAGAIQSLDSEFLHDFRVAVRRTRSALGQIKGVLPSEASKRFRREFAWLGRVTGPTRDLDVYLLKLPTYAAALPDSVRDDLDPLTRFLEARHARAQSELARALSGDRYSRLIESWQAFLRSEPGAGDWPEAAREPIAPAAGRWITKAHRRVLERGRGLAGDAPDDALHRLRIDCKKLRYLLELFRSLYPSAEIRGLIRSLKRLQDNLGDFNDFAVQRGMLARFGAELASENPDSSTALRAIGRLVGELEAGQARARSEFSDRFAAFASRSTTRRLSSMLASGGGS